MPITGLCKEVRITIRNVEKNLLLRYKIAAKDMCKNIKASLRDIEVYKIKLGKKR